MRRETRRANRRLRLRRIRALLASGLVLGIGAAGTLAAWNDSEFGSATFTAGVFGIQGAPDGTTFTDHAAAPGATLNFQLPPTAMTPGMTTYALYSVRTIANSVAGTVQLTAAAANGATPLGAALRYGVRTIAGTTCNATTYAAGTVLVADSTVLTTGSATPLALSAEQGNQINYCFAVTLPMTADNSVQGLAATASWQFPATAN